MRTLGGLGSGLGQLGLLGGVCLFGPHPLLERGSGPALGRGLTLGDLPQALGAGRLGLLTRGGELLRVAGLGGVEGLFQCGDARLGRAHALLGAGLVLIGGGERGVQLLLHRGHGLPGLIEFGPQFGLGLLVFFLDRGQCVALALGLLGQGEDLAARLGECLLLGSAGLLGGAGPLLGLGQAGAEVGLRRLTRLRRRGQLVLMALLGLCDGVVRLLRGRSDARPQGGTLGVAAFEGDPVGVDLGLEPGHLGGDLGGGGGLGRGDPLLEGGDLGLQFTDALLGRLVCGLQFGPGLVHALHPPGQFLARPLVFGVHRLDAGVQVLLVFVGLGEHLFLLGVPDGQFLDPGQGLLQLRGRRLEVRFGGTEPGAEVLPGGGGGP